MTQELNKKKRPITLLRNKWDNIHNCKVAERGRRLPDAYENRMVNQAGKRVAGAEEGGQKATNAAPIRCSKAGSLL